MKGLFLFLTFMISINSIAQSKKEQIAILNYRIDSLNREYFKETRVLRSKIETIGKSYYSLSNKTQASKEQLDEKQATIASKFKTIETLKIQNSQLVKALNDLSAAQDKRLATKSQLELEIGRLLMGQNSNEYYAAAEEATPDAEGTATEEDYIMEAEAAADAAEADDYTVSESDLEDAPSEVEVAGDTYGIMIDHTTTDTHDEVAEESPEEKVIEFPDVEAQFPGGSAAMMQWISKNIQYPEISIENNEQGRVFLAFIVEKDGSISNVAIQRGVSPDLDREAKRVVRNMPRWIPGEVSGKKCRARCRLPLNFHLN